MVWEEGRPDGERGTSDLWLADVAGKAPPRRLTFGEGREQQPTWSPDGRSLYLHQPGTAGGETSPQIFRLDLGTGAVAQVSELAGGVDLWAMSPDGTVIYLVDHAPEDTKDPFAALRKAHAGPTYVEASPQRSTLLALDTRTWRATPVETGSHSIFGLTVSPDGRFVAMLIAPDSPLIFREGGSAVVVLDRRDDSVATVPDLVFREEAPSPYGWLHDLAWAPDSRRLAFGVSFDGHPGSLQVATLSDAGTDEEIAVLRLPRDGDWTMIGGSVQWHPRDGRVCFTVSDHAHIQARCQDPAAPRADARASLIIKTKSFLLKN